MVVLLIVKELRHSLQTIYCGTVLGRYLNGPWAGRSVHVRVFYDGLDGI